MSGQRRKVASLRKLAKSASAAAKQGGERRSGQGVAAHALPSLEELRGVARPVDPAELVDREPGVIALLRSDYQTLSDEPKSITFSPWPAQIHRAILRLQAGAFGGENPGSGFPNMPGLGATVTAALRVGLDVLREDPAIQLSIRVGLDLLRSEEGSDEARDFLVDLWETVDPGEGLSPGAGRKRPLWIGRGVADLLGTLARACGSKVQSVGIVAASLALAAEPVSSEKQRAQFAEVAARFLTSSRTKIAGLIGAAGALR